MKINRLQCPECHSYKTIKIGFRMTRRGKIQRYQCNNCGRNFSAEIKRKCEWLYNIDAVVCPRVNHPVSPYSECSKCPFLEYKDFVVGKITGGFKGVYCNYRFKG